MRIILIDPSAVVRAIFAQNLKDYTDIEVIASVSNGSHALHAIETSAPDAIVSDADAGLIDGKNALKVFTMEKHLPVVVLEGQKGKSGGTLKNSSLTYMEKPGLNSYNSQFFNSLVNNLKKNCNPTSSVPEKNAEYKILCIGASTGGPTAVSEVLAGLGKNFPLPVLYTQHVEVGSDVALVKWLSDVCGNIKIKLASNGEVAKGGVVYMAPADIHLEIDHIGSDGRPVLKLSKV